MEQTQVLIVDDSAFMRRAIQTMLESDESIKVVGRARNGKEALDEIRRLKPDVVTLNLNIPEMDGLTALKIIMAEMPLPVIIVSAAAEEGERITMDALSIGAVDFVTKPTAEASLDIHTIRQTLIKKVKAAGEAFYKAEGNPASANISTAPKSDVIKVLIVDDSAFMRISISNLLDLDPNIEVVGTARDGQDAIHKLETLQPDVMTLDLNMPGMDGFAALEYIMKRKPLPIIIISRYTTDASTPETIRALELGAVDFIPIKETVGSAAFKKSRHELIEKVKAAASANVVKLKTKRDIPILKPSTSLGRQSKAEVVVIGASTGGPQALETIITALPADFPASVLIAQHMPEKFTYSFAQRLNEKSHITVREAKMKDKVESGIVLLAPGGYHMEVIKSGWQDVSVVINKSEDRQMIKPSVDILMKSVAALFGANSIAVLLTGMGNDGVEGMKAIKSAGGITIAQDENSSLIFGMPKTAIAAGCVDETLPLEKMAQKITDLCAPKTDKFQRSRPR